MICRTCLTRKWKKTLVAVLRQASVGRLGIAPFPVSFLVSTDWRRAKRRMVRRNSARTDAWEYAKKEKNQLPVAASPYWREKSMVFHTCARPSGPSVRFREWNNVCLIQLGTSRLQQGGTDRESTRKCSSSRMDMRGHTCL